ncbi:transmembrane protein 74B-like [Haliotis rubra]|uniref:transmembrane protein 74B-like n=1 Tax=Haliotis rubra TaxID=36100 RepID=UPI001EE51B3A|nr:transmembrane protein 74B-like [Haliotis rubra]
MTNTNTNDSGRFLEPPQTSLDYLILFAIGSVFIGLIISTIGYIIPRSHTPDPSLTARQQEAVDTYYAKLGNDLDICIVVGMAFIGLGGIVTSAVFCKTIICRECDVGDEETYGLTDHPGQVDGEGYGTVEGGQYRPLHTPTSD